jgi:hypothetical protein
VNALADARVGAYLNEHFVSSFQKVATFRIVNGKKQGGNVAAYFCAPDGRVLHVVAGPVNAAVMLREAKWVVETAQQAIAESQKTGKPFKALFRQQHAERLRREYGLAVEAITYDAVTSGDSVLTYRDPTGRPLAPVLPPAPINGPDVAFGHQQERLAKSGSGGPGMAPNVVDVRGRRWRLDNQGQVHALLAAHSLQPIDKLYASVFEGILGERVSTQPVQVVTPFPWRKERQRVSQ